MADYWKSNPRKYCEVCKCWFGDNKASIDFHERGRRHQQNVKKMLSSARQRSAENEKDAARTNEMLATIEMDAAAAYVKDLGGDDGEDPPPAKKRAKAPSTPAVVTPPVPQIEEPFQIRKARAHMEILQTIQERQEKTQREVAEITSGPPPPPPPSQWQQAATPEGKLYYYNIFTRETQWEEPEDFVPLPRPPPTVPPPISSSTPTFTHAGTNQREGEEGTDHKRPEGPYGGWTTVAIHPRQPDAEEEEDGEGERDSGEDGDSEEEEGGERDEEEKLNFEERTVDSLPPPQEAERSEFDVKVGSFKGFGFKKRSTGKPQIRQRSSELS